MVYNSTTGLSKIRPAGRIRPIAHFYQACEGDKCLTNETEKSSNLDRPVVQPVARHCTDWDTWLTPVLATALKSHCSMTRETPCCSRDQNETSIDFIRMTPFSCSQHLMNHRRRIKRLLIDRWLDVMMSGLRILVEYIFTLLRAGCVS
jgi:hypothetical protein